MSDLNFEEITLDEDIFSIDKNFVKDCILTYNDPVVKNVEVKDDKSCCEKLFFYIIGNENPDW